MKAEVFNVIADKEELRWFFDHVIQKPAVNESYSAVFVSRHKKLTKEEQAKFGLTRKESEFLMTQTFRRKNFKDALYQDEENNWTFDGFLRKLQRFEVNKEAFATPAGFLIPDTTTSVIFYVNPCDDTKVVRAFVDKYLDVSQGIAKAMLEGKTTVDNLQSYQWFGNAESAIKHLKANQKGTRYWLDFDIDVPAWFKANEYRYDFPDGTKGGYFTVLKNILNARFGKGNYVIVDTSGGYHVLVRTSAIKANPHDFCKEVKDIYDEALHFGEEPYLDEKGNCKFECVVNDSQIPGLPLPGTYQYNRPVTVLNKEDFD